MFEGGNLKCARRGGGISSVEIVGVLGLVSSDGDDGGEGVELVDVESSFPF